LAQSGHGSRKRFSYLLLGRLRFCDDVTFRRFAHLVSDGLTVTSDALGLAIGPMAETANDLQEALNKARQMCETGLVNVSIEDDAGHKIDGDELLACITGKKEITEDLQAV
jgi:hypothetical protein